MKIIIALCFLIFNCSIYADVLPEAKSEIKITLAKKPTTRPMTVAFIPGQKKYYIADGGLAPLGSETEAPISKSLIHTYDQSGKYLSSTQAGFDNRSIFYNELTFQLNSYLAYLNKGQNDGIHNGILLFLKAALLSASFLKLLGIIQELKLFLIPHLK